MSKPKRVLVEGVQVNEWAINLGADGGTTTWTGTTDGEFGTGAPVVHDYPDGHPPLAVLADAVVERVAAAADLSDTWKARHRLDKADEVLRALAAQIECSRGEGGDDE